MGKKLFKCNCDADGDESLALIDDGDVCLLEWVHNRTTPMTHAVSSHTVFITKDNATKLALALMMYVAGEPDGE